MMISTAEESISFWLTTERKLDAFTTLIPFREGHSIITQQGYVLNGACDLQRRHADLVLASARRERCLLSLQRLDERFQVGVVHRLYLPMIHQHENTRSSDSARPPVIRIATDALPPPDPADYAAARLAAKDDYPQG